jgi:hypothetical protein
MRSRPLFLNVILLLASISLLIAGVLIGRSGDTNTCIRLCLLALLLTVIGSISNLVLTVVLLGKHEPRTAIVYLLGFTVLLALFVLLRTVIIRVVGFDLPTELVKALITGKLPNGNPMP